VDHIEQPLRVLIVDDDAFFRRGIREILNEADGIHVVGEAADGEQAIRLAAGLRARGLDLVLLDRDMPSLDGIATTTRLAAEEPGLPVVLLATALSESDMVESIQAGAIGYLAKSLAPDALVRVLLAFKRGEGVPIAVDHVRALLERVRDRQRPPPELPNLTAREKEVLELIARGTRDRDIAAQLVISESTVKKHVQNILRKLHARNRAEAVARLRSA